MRLFLSIAVLNLFVLKDTCEGQTDDSPPRNNTTRAAFTCHTDENDVCTFDGIQLNFDTYACFVPSSDKAHGLVQSISFKESKIPRLSRMLCRAFPRSTNLSMQYLGVEIIDADALIPCTRLIELNLKGNKITSLPLGLFERNLELISLNFGLNQIKEIHCSQFHGLRKLEKLALYSNNLYNFPFFSLKDSTKLKSLDLHTNFLSDLNVTELVQYLPKLERVSYDGNDVACDRVVEINEELSRNGVETQFFHYRRDRYHEFTKVEGILCLLDKDWSAVHYRKVVMGKLKDLKC